MLELPFLLNWIGTLTLSLLLKLPPRKLKPWFAPWSFFLLRLLFISINLSYSLVWNLLSCSSISSSCYMDMLDKLQKKLCMTAGPSFIASLETWAHHRNVASASLLPASAGITLVDVHLNWLNWFHFLILMGSLLVILIVCIISKSPFLDVIRMSMLTISFLAQLDSGILCLYNAFLWPTINDQCTMHNDQCTILSFDLRL